MGRAVSTVAFAEVSVENYRTHVGAARKIALTQRITYRQVNCPMPASTPKIATNNPDRRRRRHLRYRDGFRVNVNYFQDDQYQKIGAHCRDISEAGIGILLAAELNCGEVTGLSFSLPGSALPWEVRAVVRYRRGYQYGFEFLSLRPEQQVGLKNYLKGLEPID